MNPSKAMLEATDYPVAIEKRSDIKAYLVGKDLYEKMIAYLEDYIDINAVRAADFCKGKDFGKIARKLSI